MDAMVSSVVHLANRDYASLVDDFIALGVLPADTNRPVVEPMMARARARFLPYTSRAPPVLLPYISRKPPVHLPYTSRTRPVHIPHSSCTHPVHISYTSRTHPVHIPYTSRTNTVHIPYISRTHPIHSPCTSRTCTSGTYPCIRHISLHPAHIPASRTCPVPLSRVSWAGAQGRVLGPYVAGGGGLDNMRNSYRGGFQARQLPPPLLQGGWRLQTALCSLLSADSVLF